MKLTEHHDLIKDLLSEGGSYRQIAKVLGVDKDTVAKYVSRHLPGFQRKPIQRAPMKILVIDIETAPNLAHVWGLWDQNVGLNQLIKSTEVMCWAAKWIDDELMRFKSVHHHGKQEMIGAAWYLLDNADAVVHYNGRSFDVPHLNREFLEAGLDPPSPFKQIDLLRVVRKQFKFPSYKLAYVAQALGLGIKVGHEGHELWVRCLAGDGLAWKTMREYNEQDVLLVENLYHRALGWISNHPSHGAQTGEEVCPNCGGDEFDDAGTITTKIGLFQQYRCTACGKHSRGTKRIDKTTLTEVVA
jgi:transposase-like protein